MCKGLLGRAGSVRISPVSTTLGPLLLWICWTLLSSGARAQAACPPPTTSQDGQCVLTNDAALTSALEASSGQTLDCRGHKLTPSAVGKDASGRSAPVSSVPEVAVFLRDVVGVQIRNCVIDGFDFGILVVDDTTAEALSRSQGFAPATVISGNVLKTRYSGISLIEADNIEIHHNRVTTTSASPIQSLLDSDSLWIYDNRLTSGQSDGRATGRTPASSAPLFPGSPDVESYADGVSFLQLPAPVIEVRFDGTYVSFVDNLAERATASLVEGNLIEPTKDAAGVRVSVIQDGLVIRNNTFTGGAWGVYMSAHALNGQLPDPAAWSRDVVVEHNSMLGPFAGAGAAAGHVVRPVIQANSITGGRRGGGSTGVALWGMSLEGATVARNLVQGHKIGLALGVLADLDSSGADARFFGARVFLNDVTGSDRAVVTPERSYTFQTELSVGGQGNHWGHTCQESGGFIEAGTLFADSNNAAVVDSHAYGVPVAETPTSSLPAPCS